MKIIKLDATDSTNSFLKDLAQSQSIENFTIVVAKNQKKGRGQVASKWVSDDGKNLTFSVFCKFDDLKIINQKYLNFAVSISVFQVLEEFNVPKLAIKWPNDILSEKQKICGILIENTLSSDVIQSSIIGIGLNVNQENFPSDVPNATSLKLIFNREFNLDVVLDLLLSKLKVNINLLHQQKYQILENVYLDNLYKKNVPSMFKDAQSILFMGKIIEVSQEGKLIIELADETVKEFGLKEVSFV